MTSPASSFFFPTFILHSWRSTREARLQDSQGSCAVLDLGTTHPAWTRRARRDVESCTAAESVVLTDWPPGSRSERASIFQLGLRGSRCGQSECSMGDDLDSLKSLVTPLVVEGLMRTGGGYRPRRSACRTRQGWTGHRLQTGSSAWRVPMTLVSVWRSAAQVHAQGGSRRSRRRPRRPRLRISDSVAFVVLAVQQRTDLRTDPYAAQVSLGLPPGYPAPSSGSSAAISTTMAQDHQCRSRSSA